MKVISNKLFLRVSGYDDAPEFAIDNKGVVRIDDEVVEDPAAIVKALADNARAWGKCVAAVEPPAPQLTGSLADQVETVVQQMTGVEVRGPWPSSEAERNDLSDERIDEIERADNVVG